MAAILDTSGEYFSRASDLIDYDAAYTRAVWIQHSAIGGVQLPLVNVTDLNNYDVFGWLNSTTYYIEVASGGSFGSSTPGSSVGDGEWHYLAIVRESATVFKAYVDAVQVGTTITTDVTSRSALSEMHLGLFTGGIPDQFYGKLAYQRDWSKALDAAGLAAEMAATSAVDTASLYNDCPLISDAVDISGNGRDWTENGTITYDADTPITAAAGFGLLLSNFRNKLVCPM